MCLCAEDNQQQHNEQNRIQRFDREVDEPVKGLFLNGDIHASVLVLSHESIPVVSRLETSANAFPIRCHPFPRSLLSQAARA
jgi:hypothetical protein